MFEKKDLISAYLKCFPEKSAQFAQDYLSDAEQYQNIIFQNNNLVYAFVIYRIIAKDEAEIIDVGVIPEFQKQGFGTKILNEMEFELKAKKIKKIHLEFRDDNFPAEKLYRKLGYIKVGERKNYYKLNGYTKDAILMIKNI